MGEAHRHAIPLKVGSCPEQKLNHRNQRHPKSPKLHEKLHSPKHQLYRILDDERRIREDGDVGVQSVRVDPLYEDSEEGYPQLN